MWPEIIKDLSEHKIRALARAVSFIENEVAGYDNLLKELKPDIHVPVIGITGPPGAGKSTLTDALISLYVSEGSKVAVLCVDPSSPFNKGALLGDRIRMSEWYNNPNVYIRSLATRGNLGGLHPKTIEITHLLRSSGFDKIIIETVGVGQSEIEIAELADVTVVVLVPEAGDDIQAMKSGLMEVAQVFVVNKSDRPGADQFVKNLRLMMPGNLDAGERVPVLKTNALTKEGIQELADAINEQLKNRKMLDKFDMLAQHAFQLIIKRKMRGITKEKLTEELRNQNQENFNLYTFVEKFD